MKTYKVVPYVAKITTSDTSSMVAEKLEILINDFASQGWTFESVEKFETAVNDPGCFGFGAKTSVNFFQLVVFSKLN
ncbi:hypothetical protein [Sediminibacterium ginsengisoli]|uniref:DUF4177 domain-containing protein n=1 Tax=Sediminibacterium ginsengisoli TaxID=413434 RepID=A0A1T4LC08_9BACT|nr:hypothetical protein [Sediminibacterium ginsengisoli]SJZ52067.1 hypothetical protein SAMN04488132_102415 [Sediminibacterium ginsengisoli]